ncbi:MAG: hypothetical protein EBR79_02000, partial [Proteobacteria bacterium]|nr:hypothetical protein [Pseudomonadota bacterium]
HTRLTTAATTFLGLPPLPLLGNIPQCKHFSQAVRQHHLASTAFPNSPAITALQTLAKKLA